MYTRASCIGCLFDVALRRKALWGGVQNHTRARRPARAACVLARAGESGESGMDSSDDDAAPEEELEAPGGSGGIRMSLNMGSLTSSGSNLFKEEDAAIKGGEVTLNFTDEAAGKEFQLNVRRQTPPRVHPGTHLPHHPTSPPAHVATVRCGADRRVCQGQDQGRVGAARDRGRRASGGACVWPCAPLVC